MVDAAWIVVIVLSVLLVCVIAYFVFIKTCPRPKQPEFVVDELSIMADQIFQRQLQPH